MAFRHFCAVRALACRWQASGPMRLSALDVADTLFHRLAWASVGALACLAFRPPAHAPGACSFAHATSLSVPPPTPPHAAPLSTAPSVSHLADAGPSSARGRTFTARDVDACALAERMGSYVAPWGVAYVAWLATPTLGRLALETASPAGLRVAPHRPRGEPVGFGLRAGDWVVSVDGEGAFASSPNALTTKLVSGGDSAVLVGRGERLVVALVRSCPSPISPAHDLPSTR